MAAVSRHSAYSPVSPRLHTSHSKGFCGARIEIIPSVYQPHQRTSLLPPLAFATFFGELNFGPSFWLFRTLYWRIFKHFFGAKLLFTIISLFLRGLQNWHWRTGPPLLSSNIFCLQSRPWSVLSPFRLRLGFQNWTGTHKAEEEEKVNHHYLVVAVVSARPAVSPTWVKTRDHNVDVDSVMVMVKNNLHGPLDPEWCTAIPFVRGKTVEGLKCKM